MSIGLALVVLVVLLLLNAFFVGAEFALVSARRDQIEPLAADGSTAARITLKAIERIALMMGGCQLGITVCSLGIGAVGEPAVASLLQAPFEALGVPSTLIHPVALVIALVVVVYLHMVLGEMVPKNVSLAGPTRAALVLGPPMYALCWVLRPIIALMNATANLVLRLGKVTPRNEVNSSFTREEVAGLVAESGREGLLDDDELSLLSGALTFETLRAADVALAADQLVVVDRDTSVAQLEELCARTGFSRFPVREGDELIGYVHLKDLLDWPAERRDEPADDAHIHAMPVVAADAGPLEVIEQMREHKVHLAQVDLPGPERGVVALEDVLEELVGEVRDATSSTGPGTRDKPSTG